MTGGVGGAGVDYWARPRKRSRVAAGDGGGGGAGAAAAGAMGVEQQQPSETLWELLESWGGGASSESLEQMRRLLAVVEVRNPSLRQPPS